MTINRFEIGKQEATPETRSRLREAFERAGVEFSDDGWVRLRLETVAKEEVAQGEAATPPTPKKEQPSRPKREKRK